MKSEFDRKQPEDIASLCTRLFRSDTFRWTLGMRNDDAETFFAPRDPTRRLLAEKRKWLDLNPEIYLATTPRAKTLIEEAWDLAVQWRHIASPGNGRTLRSLAEEWEPDLLLIEGENLSLAAGCVCFPSSWDLRTAIAKPVNEIHEVVPQLNAQLGTKVDRFLRAIQLGKSFSRMNWGISRSGELNYHPTLNRRQLDATVTMEELYLRIEHQLFTTLKNGLLMGLRIESIPLTQLSISSEAWTSAIRLIRTMPSDIAEYKNMSSSLNAIADAMTQYAF